MVPSLPLVVDGMIFMALTAKELGVMLVQHMSLIELVVHMPLKQES